MKRPLSLSGQVVVLPKGTRVVLRRDLPGDDGYVHRAASLATVLSVAYNTYRLETPSGRRLTAQRDQITVQKADILRDLGVRQWDFARLERTVIYSATVGSRAWGLDNRDSDEDVRGAFVAPFDDISGLWSVPAEIHDPHHERAYWEVARFVTHGLKGDANTLETLWSPLHRILTPLGAELVEQRDMFVSMNILGSFGRYAQSQFAKIERAQRRHRAQLTLVDAIRSGQVGRPVQAYERLRRVEGGTEQEWAAEVKAILRSLHDRGVIASSTFDALLEAVAAGRADALRPATFRPKNAYNLLRLLYSCRRWLTVGEPLIRVEGSERDVLLAIKEQRQPIEDTLALAKSAAADIDEAAESANLPAVPDYERADSFLRRCRRAAARRALVHVVADTSRDDAEAPLGFQDDWVRRLVPVALPGDVDVQTLRDFLEERARRAHANRRRPLWVALTGAHAYGFASPDSDLDLKGVHSASADDLLGGTPPAPTDAYLDVWQGREYDYTTSELAGFQARLLAGNGNALEQLLGPFVVLSSDGGEALAEWARANLSRRSFDHYRGFLSGIRREYLKEAQRGLRKAKRLLYGYRVALTGIHLLSEGRIEMDVGRWTDEWPRIGELLIVKSNAEGQTLPAEAEDRPYLEDLDQLQARLLEAHERSTLPDAPTDDALLRRLVVALRA